MANNNNTHHFTVSDIEKYHRGQLSAKQMHDLEKSALDDPFLADALEGYAMPGVNAQADIAELENRLGEKMEGAKVVTLPASTSRNSFPFFRAAVLILFVAGAGFLVYQFGFNKKDNAIAQTEPVKKETATVPTDTTTTTTNSTPTKPGIKTETIEGSVADQPSTTITNTEAKPGAVSNDEKQVTATTITQPVIVPPVKTTEVKTVKNKNEQDRMADQKELAREAVPLNEKKKKTAEEITATKDIGAGQKQADKNVAVATRKTDNDGLNSSVNTFRGRVTDRENNGVPFANVTNVQDNNAGTYTDARGYFNLTYPDSVLNVQVRSIGFENSNSQLRNAVPNNQVIMQDDRSVSEVVLSNQKPNAAARSRDNNLKLEEPEPIDGWVYYDAYLANNLNVPEDLRAKQTTESGNVDISFEVDKNGEPVNIRVEKSLCNKCDKEAIRLVKEGPKWKRNANKKGRTTVTINF